MHGPICHFRTDLNALVLQTSSMAISLSEYAKTAQVHCYISCGQHMAMESRQTIRFASTSTLYRIECSWDDLELTQTSSTCKMNQTSWSSNWPVLPDSYRNSQGFGGRPGHQKTRVPSASHSTACRYKDSAWGWAILRAVGNPWFVLLHASHLTSCGLRYTENWLKTFASPKIQCSLLIGSLLAFQLHISAVHAPEVVITEAGHVGPFSWSFSDGVDTWSKFPRAREEFYRCERLDSRLTSPCPHQAFAFSPSVTKDALEGSLHRG